LSERQKIKISDLSSMSLLRTMLGVFISYFITAKIGLTLDADSGFATLVWAPTGIALAAVILFGYRIWPAIATAAFLVNVVTGAPILTAFGITFGNTLEALIGAFLLTQFKDFHKSLDRQKDVLALVSTIILSTTFSATIGAVSLVLSGIQKWEGFLSTWKTWWIGDVLGGLIVAPFILVWGTRSHTRINLWRLADASLLVGLFVIFSQLIFSTQLVRGDTSIFRFPYMLFPLVIWAALRFSQVGSVTLNLGISIVAIWYTSQGLGPFSHGVLRDNFVLLNNFLTISSLTGLILAASILERKQSIENLKEAENSLRKSSSRKAAILESSLDCIITIDHDGKIVDFNKAAENTFGHRRDEVRGLDLADVVIPPNLRDAHRQGLARYFSSGLSTVIGKRIEMPAMRSDGTEFPAELFIDVLILNGQSFFTGFIRDITREKSTIEALLTAKEVAESATQTKSAFLANMSHEIRTPLGAVIGFSELLTRAETTFSDKNNFIEIIRRNGKFLSDIINDILDLSKVEAGKLDVESRESGIADIILESMSLLKLQASEKGIELKISYEHPLPKKIKTDPLRLRQILLNVLGNSIKFTEQGFVHATVKLISYEGKPKLAFIVEDTGRGISAEQAKNLFKPFSQGDESTKRRFGGTGLGLVLSKRIASLLGGDLVLTKSEVGKGSTFTLTIDPGPTDKTSFFESSDQLSTPQPKQLMLDQERLEGVKILLAEDSIDNQMLICKLLTMAGAQVDTAENGKVALEKARQGKYDVLLMDLQMPVMDGYHATSELRKEGYRTPIIALTAHALKEERARCLASGFDDHISKPINLNSLISSIAHFSQTSSQG